jgi:hypothetical protein
MEKGSGRSQWAPQPFSYQPFPIFFCPTRSKLLCSHRYPTRRPGFEQMARADTKGHFVTSSAEARTRYKLESCGRCSISGIIRQNFAECANRCAFLPSRLPKNAQSRINPVAKFVQKRFTSLKRFMTSKRCRTLQSAWGTFQPHAAGTPLSASVYRPEPQY